VGWGVGDAGDETRAYSGAALLVSGFVGPRSGRGNGSDPPRRLLELSARGLLQRPRTGVLSAIDRGGPTVGGYMCQCS
jgi:hypothetical protein